MKIENFAPYDKRGAMMNEVESDMICRYVSNRYIPYQRDRREKQARIWSEPSSR